MNEELTELKLTTHQSILTIQSMTQQIDDVREQLLTPIEDEFELEEIKYWNLKGIVHKQLLPFLNSINTQLGIVVNGYHEIFERLAYYEQYNPKSRTVDKKQEGNLQFSKDEQHDTGSGETSLREIPISKRDTWDESKSENYFNL